MSVLIIPHAGTYYGHFEFAVVQSGQPPARLNVTVREAQQSLPVYSTTEAWPSGNKLALPPGDYCVRAELLLPRLSGTCVVLDAVEMRYCVLLEKPHKHKTPVLTRASVATSTSSTTVSTGGRALREEVVTGGSGVQHIVPMLNVDDNVDAVSLSEHNTPNGKNNKSSRSSTTADVTQSNRLYQQSVFYSREPTPTQALAVLSAQPSVRETPIATPFTTCVSNTGGDKQLMPQSYSRGEGGKRSISTEAEAAPASGWIWGLSPTLDNNNNNNDPMLRNSSSFYSEKLYKSFNSQHVFQEYTTQQPEYYLATVQEQEEERIPSVHNSIPLASRGRTPAEYMKIESNMDSANNSSAPIFQENSISSSQRQASVSIPCLDKAVEVNTMKLVHHEVHSRVNGLVAHSSCNSTPAGVWDTKTPLYSHKLTPTSMHRGNTPVKNVDIFVDPYQQEQQERRESWNSQAGESKQSIVPIPSKSSMEEKGASKTLFFETNNNNTRERSMNQSRVKSLSSHHSNGNNDPIFLVSPPDMIDIHVPFSFAMALGPLNSKPLSSTVFVNVMVEEVVKRGIAPAEPVICVVPATLAAVPTVARGVHTTWVCSPSIRMSERRPVMEILGSVMTSDDEENKHVLLNGMAISTACVGPTCDGQAFSGIQFVIDAFEATSSWQFFLSFREIESLDDDDDDDDEEEKEEEEIELSTKRNTGVVYGVQQENKIDESQNIYNKYRQISNLDEHALEMEILYNSLPYIRCFKDEGYEMLLEVHRKNTVVACESIKKGSHIAMYFGTVEVENGSGQQSYLSILVDYRTVYCYAIRGIKIPEKLRVIILSRVEFDERRILDVSVRLRDMELLSQQRRLLAFVDEVNVNEARSTQRNSNKQQEEYQEYSGGKPGCISAWVAGENPGARAWKNITIV